MTITTLYHLDPANDYRRNIAEDVRPSARPSNPLTRAWRAIQRFFTNPEQDSEAEHERCKRDTKNGFHHGERFLL